MIRPRLGVPCGAIVFLTNLLALLPLRSAIASGQLLSDEGPIPRMNADLEQRMRGVVPCNLASGRKQTLLSFAVHWHPAVLDSMAERESEFPAVPSLLPRLESRR